MVKHHIVTIAILGCGLTAAAQAMEGCRDPVEPSEKEQAAAEVRKCQVAILARTALDLKRAQLPPQIARDCWQRPYWDFLVTEEQMDATWGMVFPKAKLGDNPVSSGKKQAKVAKGDPHNTWREI